jgi:hypothetical protein
MSWLSAALKRNKLDVLNKIAKPVQAVVNPMLDKMPVVGSIKAGAEAVGDLIPAGASKAVANATLPTLGTIGSGIGSALTGNGGMNALAFAQLLNAAQLGKKSSGLADDALKTQNQLFADKSGLRSSGIAGMQAPRTELPQLAKLGAVANPFARTV